MFPLLPIPNGGEQPGWRSWLGFWFGGFASAPTQILYSYCSCESMAFTPGSDDPNQFTAGSVDPLGYTAGSDQPGQFTAGSDESDAFTPGSDGFFSGCRC